MRHTPGPWKLLGGEAIANTVIVQDRPGMDVKYIAQTNTSHHSADECVANAKLIAAAPEMLEALELISTAKQRGFGIDYAEGCARQVLHKIKGGDK
jgi:hypothetical protein